MRCVCGGGGGLVVLSIPHTACCSASLSDRSLFVLMLLNTSNVHLCAQEMEAIRKDLEEQRKLSDEKAEIARKNVCSDVGCSAITNG